MEENVCTTDRCSEKCNDQVYRVQKTEMVLTPWWRELGTDNIIEAVPLPKQNYTSYDVFCLESKIVSDVTAIDEAALPCFISYEYLGVMRLCMNLIKGGEFIPLDKSTADHLQKLVDKYTKLYPDFCIIYDSKHGPPDLPGAWINSILPYLSLDPQYEAFVENGYLYVKFVTEAFAEDADYMKLQITQNLRSLYKQGVIPLLSISMSSIIASWGLINYISPQTKSKEVEEAALYFPDWTDTRFASSMVAFLYGLIQGRQVITLRGSPNLTVRHAIARRLLLKGFSFSFDGEKLYVGANSLFLASSAADEVDKAMDEVPDRVATFLVSSNRLDRWESKIHRRFPLAKALIYRIADNPEFMLSWTIPLEIDSISAARDVQDSK